MRSWARTHSVRHRVVGSFAGLLDFRVLHTAQPVVFGLEKPFLIALQHLGNPDLELIGGLSKAVHDPAEQRLVICESVPDDSGADLFSIIGA